MNAFFAKLTRFCLAGMMLVTAVLSPLTGHVAKPIQAAKEDCKASIAVLSDLHLQNYGLFEWLFDIGLEDLNRADKRMDALIVDGDLTNTGADREFKRFAASIKEEDPAEKVLFAMGNHDSWCGTWDGEFRSPEKSITRFCKYTEEIAGIKTDKPYYTTEVNGYPVIILGSEANHTGATITDEQVAWFAEQMDTLCDKGKPVFVFLHQSINGTHGLPYNWEMEETDDPAEGGIGDASDAILAILQQHKNVFYVSGHIHAGFSREEDENCYVSVEKYDGYTLINVPSYLTPDFVHGGCKQFGTGYVFEIYEDSVLLRARNFVTGTWLTEYDETITLTK